MVGLNVRGVISDTARPLYGMPVDCLNSIKRRLLEFFVLGVPIYRLRFRVPVSKRTIQGFFRLIRAVLAIKEECREPFHGTIECDETTFGGRRKGKRGWGVVEPRGAAILTP